MSGPALLYKPAQLSSTARHGTHSLLSQQTRPLLKSYRPTARRGQVLAFPRTHTGGWEKLRCENPEHAMEANEQFGNRGARVTRKLGDCRRLADQGIAKIKTSSRDFLLCENVPSAYDSRSERSEHISSSVEVREALLWPVNFSTSNYSGD